MPIQPRIRILSLVLLLLLTACGQKGPLFMPDRDQAEKQTDVQD
ncbi:MAG: lipoprotein [Candidatus Thiodiazotropha sp.]